MVKMVVRDALADGTFSPPETLYRVGNKLGRLEQGGKVRIILNFPDAWLLSPSGTGAAHQRDDDPAGVVRFPVVKAEGSPRLSLELELGGEREYMRRYGARADRHEPLSGRDCVVYLLDIEGVTVELLVDAATGVPAKVTVSRSGTVLRSRVYDEYRTDLPVDPTLFQKPTGVPVVEPPGPPKPPGPPAA
jgi:hypothetical protein